MFSPKDNGLKYPLQLVIYNGRHTICSADGMELFLIDLIRPSLEAKEMLKEWGENICEKFNNANNGHLKQEVKVEHSLVSSAPEHILTSNISTKETKLVKRGRGRPKGSKNK